MNTKPNTLPRVTDLAGIETLDVAQIGAELMNWYVNALRRFGHDIIEAEDYAEIIAVHTRLIARCERQPPPAFEFSRSLPPNKAEARSLPPNKADAN